MTSRFSTAGCNGRSQMRLAALSVLIIGIIAQHAHASAAGGATFDADFFPAGMAPKVDLSRFEKGDYVAPGTYRADVVLNDEWRARTDIVFAAVSDSGDTQPCFDADSLTRYGVDWEKVATDSENRPLVPVPEGQFCGPIGDYIPGATLGFDSNTQVLTLSVPQVYVQRHARGYVDPSQWDAGITAAVLGYNANLYRTSGRDDSRTHGYLGVNTSFNLGPWHFHHLGSLSWSEGRGSQYQNSASYLQHDIPSLRAQLTLGDTFTPGDLFDSVRLRGARLYSDDRMLPQSLRGYAPVVRGVAETNARVVIRQRGFVIYDTSVAPGPFVIDDLYPTGYGGDLDVEVTEADGRVKQFAVPFSAVAQLLRPGLSRWSLAAGKVDELNLVDEPNVLQGTYQRGLNNRVTGYTGATFATGYRSLMSGAAFNTGAGAVSVDFTQASNKAPGQSATQGLSVRVGYNKNFIQTGTDFAVAAYRYSTSGFVGLQDAAALRDAAARGLDDATLQRQRSRMDVSINQMLGDRGGMLFLAGSARDYWNSPGHQVDFSAGYNNRWRSLSYSLSLQRTRDSVQGAGLPGLEDRIPGAPDSLYQALDTRHDTRLFLTINMPLGRSSRAPTMTGLYSRSENDASTSQLSLAGTAGAEDRMTYGVALSRTDGSHSLDLNGRYNSTLANFGGGYSRGSGYEQFSAGASGGLVAHGGGVTLSPPLGDTIGLVHAPDAAGARVENGQGAKVDSRGYAVVPYLMPYELNTVTLDPKGTDVGVELKETTQNVAPRAGTVALLRYETSSGRALIIETALPDGRPVPFGADVVDDKGDKRGVVGQASRLYVTGLERSGVLTVRWGEGAMEACRVTLQLQPDVKGGRAEYETLVAPCTPDRSDTSSTNQVTNVSEATQQPGGRSS